LCLLGRWIARVLRGGQSRQRGCRPAAQRACCRKGATRRSGRRWGADEGRGAWVSIHHVAKPEVHDGERVGLELRAGRVDLEPDAQAFGREAFAVVVLDDRVDVGEGAALRPLAMIGNPEIDGSNAIVPVSLAAGVAALLVVVRAR